MEQSGIRANVATLTSLLQAAVRADDRELTNKIDAEIRRRGMENNLIVWTERFKEAGKRKDLSKINYIFQAFRRTGIPMDIVFINTILGAILNAGHLQLAELIYLRLRWYVLTQFGEERNLPLPPGKMEVRFERREFVRTWEKEIMLQKELEWELKRRRIVVNDMVHGDGTTTPFYSTLKTAMNTNVKSYAASLIPQYGTIRLFISYHCHYTGRMKDVAFYLNELNRFQITPKYSTYVDLLHGFFLWHKSQESEWSAERLEAIFSIIRKGIEKGQPPIPITYIVALTAIRAFGKIHGGKAAREVWMLLKPWMVVNDNSNELKELRTKMLETLVTTIEKGGKLQSNGTRSGQQWRVIDWRTD